MSFLRGRLRSTPFSGRRLSSGYDPMVEVPPLDPQHQRLQGRIEDDGELDGALSVTQRLSGLVDGGGELYGHLWPPLLLKGRIESGGELFGDLHQAVRLQGMIDGGGELTGDLSHVALGPSFIAHSGWAHGAANVNLSPPVETQVGDTLILIAIATGNAINKTLTGWTAQYSQSPAPDIGTDPNGCGQMVWSRVATGTDDVVIPDIGTRNAGIMLVFRDVTAITDHGKVMSTNANVSNVSPGLTGILDAADSYHIFIASAGTSELGSASWQAHAYWDLSEDSRILAELTGTVVGAAVGIIKGRGIASQAAPTWQWTNVIPNRIAGSIRLT